jgi:pyruvate/2-oxoglutarate dehydrogenase complex dihydrolipoamide acyltransferase (E2) component
MASNLFLPELGSDLTTGEVTRILARPGDRIEAGQILLELETDKASIEVPATLTGIVDEIKISTGQKISVGDLVLTLREPASAAAAVPSRRELFICYRREDSEHAAGRLYERLIGAFGDDAVFMDIDSIPLGADFVDHVNEQIACCVATIVMIGPGWLDALDKRGRRRLDNPEDTVRAEIAAALKQKIPVIPVLVQNAAMPLAEELPDDIKVLARRNGIELSHGRWKTDVDRLIDQLHTVVRRTVAVAAPPKASAPPPEPPPAPAAPPAAPHVERAASACLCYRREDTTAAAAKLRDRLVRSHGDSVLPDFSVARPPGKDTWQQMTRHLARCRIVLVLIGRSWLKPIDKRGRRLIDDRQDAVRVAIAIALREKIRVVAVLLDGATMPKAEQLPDNVRGLSRCTHVRLSNLEWRPGEERLVKEVEAALKV